MYCNWLSKLFLYLDYYLPLRYLNADMANKRYENDSLSWEIQISNIECIELECYAILDVQGMLNNILYIVTKL